MTAERTRPYDLSTGQRAVVGRTKGADVRLDHKSIAAEHVALTAEQDGTARAEVLAPCLLNGVQCARQVVLRPGDELSFGEVSLIIARHSVLTGSFGTAVPFEAFLELLRNQQTAAVSVVRGTGPLPAGLHCVLAKGFTAVAGAEGVGVDGDPIAALDLALWRSLNPGADDEEVPSQDPVMLRLSSIAERLSSAPLVISGERGSGRHTLARRLERELGVQVTVGESGPHLLPMPALRDRPLDIAPLAEAFIRKTRRLLGRGPLPLTAKLRARLGRYGWPGNVHELRLYVVRAALLALGDELRPEHLPSVLLDASSDGANLRAALKGAEKEALLLALDRTRWNVTRTARELGLPRRTIVYRMSRLGLRRPARPR